jgi:lipopolysaccharide/colanic/teichoic acid biosynthesis glycosyltransferase
MRFPQFANVLMGQMSLVGPRPSPEAENQLCPAWRDVRLSVRPGITGLWQLNRRREPGEDFQEWIKYDIEYVQRASIWLDFQIMVNTAWIMIKGRPDRGSK